MPLSTPETSRGLRLRKPPSRRRRDRARGRCHCRCERRSPPMRCSNRRWPPGRLRRRFPKPPAPPYSGGPRRHRRAWSSGPLPRAGQVRRNRHCAAGDTASRAAAEGCANAARHAPVTKPGGRALDRALEAPGGDEAANCADGRAGARGAQHPCDQGACAKRSCQASQSRNAGKQAERRSASDDDRRDRERRQGNLLEDLHDLLEDLADAAFEQARHYAASLTLPANAGLDRR
jgi:hypothetical protein